MASRQCDPPITEQEFTSPSRSSDPAAFPPLPYFSRLVTALRVWFFKSFVSLALRFLPLIYRGVQPNFTKYYDVRPSLECRVFLPANAKSDKLPLYINIHGGGFAICNPSVDDHFARPFADKNSILVVSINYRKAPTYRFPIPVADTVALINAVISDPLLPIDKSRVCVGGFSAGGNLTLTAALHPSLHGKISALLPIYPVVDFSGRYKGAYRKDPYGNRDMLESAGNLFSWAYIPQRTDKKHPLLSPIYAPRSAFAAKKMFFVGAEYDYLCQEANVMARMLAGTFEEGRDTDVSGFEDSWEKDGVRWRMCRGVQHGFTHSGKKGEQEKNRKVVMEELYKEMARWLKDEVWGGKANGSLMDQ
jgi:acetyl esterase/lipase